MNYDGYYETDYYNHGYGYNNNNNNHGGGKYPSYPPAKPSKGCDSSPYCTGYNCCPKRSPPVHPPKQPKCDNSPWCDGYNSNCCPRPTPPPPPCVICPFGQLGTNCCPCDPDPRCPIERFAGGNCCLGPPPREECYEVCEFVGGGRGGKGGKGGKGGYYGGGFGY